MHSNKAEKKELLFIMTAGCLLGILCFAMVYGLKIVNPTYDAWIFSGDIDLQQHYVGFCHFRNTPWKFPIGLIDSLSVPYSMSIVYTDSIPIFALIFKLFSNVLPLHFQYFGLFGLMSFMLMGALSPVLIRRFCGNKIVCVGGSLFFILSYPVLQRMFYHTALSAQWIIVLSLIVWFYTDINDRKQLKKICIYWTLIGILSVLIHSYFVFMCGLILLSQIVEGLLKTCTNLSNIKTEYYKVMPLICMGVSSFIMLFILGGFYGAGSVSGDGFGSFDANLSAFINPLEYSKIFSGFKLYGMFEFEGFAYLGIGILLLGIVAIVMVIIKNSKGDRDVAVDNNKKLVMLVLAVVCFVFACFPNFTFGSVKLFSVPVPGFIKSILGICRTNARFVWVAMYIVIISVLWFVGCHYEKNFVKILFLVAVVAQLFEMSDTVKGFRENYTSNREIKSVWSELQAEDVFNEKDKFVFMYDDSDIMMDTAFTAYLNNMSQNSFYYARTIYDEIDADILKWSDEFINGNIDNKVLYIFRDEDYTDEFKEVVNKSGLNEYIIDGHYVISK